VINIKKRLEEAKKEEIELEKEYLRNDPIYQAAHVVIFVHENNNEEFRRKVFSKVSDEQRT
jgi:hypothetical protein